MSEVHVQAQAQALKKPKTTYYYKLFRVKRTTDGKATTVSIDPILVTRACQLMGGLPSVGKVVREAASNFKPDVHKNRSGYVSQHLREEVVRMSAERRLTANA